jgi:large subunit ribosomal protein L17
MRHHYAGRKLKRTASHKKALLSNLASSLFEHKRLTTTVAKAKELRPFAEQLITRAKHAHLAEKNAAQGTDVHNRRMVGRFIRNKAVLQELFDTIAPLVADRPGGYTRITKLGLRRGDKAMEAMIELVDWSNPTDGRSSTTKRKAKATPKKPKPAAVPKAAAPVAAAAPVVAEEVIDETPVVEAEAPAAEAPAAEAPAADAPAADTADAPTE